jgi:hypothetical protein
VLYAQESMKRLRKGWNMYDQPYLDVLIKEEDRMMRNMLRNFVEREMMPVRQKIDDDKEHTIVNKILQGLTDLGIQRGGDDRQSSKRVYPKARVAKEIEVDSY